MKVCFLDFDGVLNSEPFLRSTPYQVGRMPEDEDSAVDPANVARLNRLAQSGVKFVVSSAWRWGRTVEQLRGILERRGFVGEVVDKTPEFIERSNGKLWIAPERGHEIQAWLNANTDGTARIVILDDNADMAHLRPKLVQTRFETGLTDADVDRAISILQAGGEA